MLHYILQTVVFQLFFLIIYDLFLKKETFFNWNRFYLLFTSIFSLVLPCIKFEGIRTMVSEQMVVQLPEVIIGRIEPPIPNGAFDMQSQVATTSKIVWSWDFLLYAGMILASLLFIHKIIKISVLIQKNPKRWKDNFTIVNLLKSNAAFSFFNYVFLGEWIKEEERETILKHELVHVSQKHSLDLMLFELLRILLWFNPLIYMYQNRITTLHEYIADAKAMKQSGKKHYYENLLSQIFETESISFTNTFFNQSLIKKRIIMLGKSKSHRSHLWKYALLIPMVLGMLIYTSCQVEPKDQIGNQDLSQYSYTLNKSGKMTYKQKRIHENYEFFLRNNSDYVAWADLNEKNDEISYSVHEKTEKIPDGFDRLQVNSSAEGDYIVFMNFGIQKSKISNDNIEVPFSVIDEVPTLDACKDLATNDEKRKCLSNHISDFVNQNFNTNIGKENNLVGKQRISVLFKIGKDGKIKNVIARAPHPALEAEAKRVISLLPQMIPGKQRGKAVVVPYSLPIIFEVHE